MSGIPCSICRHKRPGKLATAYWAWFLADGSRAAWKVRYCHLCAPDELLPQLRKMREVSISEDVFACLGCGGDASNDSDPVYLTLYIPNREVEEYSIQLDSACAAKFRGPIVDQGERLQDRGIGVRGPSPSLTVWDTLSPAS